MSIPKISNGDTLSYVEKQNAKILRLMLTSYIELLSWAGMLYMYRMVEKWYEWLDLKC